MHAAFFHEASNSVRFWVPIAGIAVGASIDRETLRRRYASAATEDDPLAAFRTHQADLEEAVRRRVAKGAVDPVTIRELDLQSEASPG